MTKKRPHEKPETLEFGPFGPRNLKQVYQFIDFSPSVPAKKREAGLGALLMLARLHAALEEEPPLDVLGRIPTNVQLLRNFLGRPHAKRHRYSEGAWRNMRSLVFECLRIAGLKVRAGRRRIPLPKAWQDLVDRLQGHELTPLYPAFRWFVEEGLEPNALGQRDFDAYETYLNSFDGRANRPSAYTTVVRAWEVARTKYADWPNVEIKIVPKVDHFVLN